MSSSSYPCHSCQVYFSSEDASVYHHRHSHPTEPDPIKLDRSYPPLTETSPRDSGEYVCYMCGNSYETRQILSTHQKLTHPGMFGYEFDACHSPFLGSNDLTRPKMEFCDNESNYECNVCHKLFSRRTDLIKHKVGPCGKGNNFECDVCQRVFLRRPDLINHRKNWHNKRIKYECDVCHREFISQSQLLGHQRFYKGRKVHEYEVQDKEFMKRNFMTKHDKISKLRVWKR